MIADRLREGAVGGSPVPLVAAAPEHAHSSIAGASGELLQDTRLPDPRLADEHDEAAAPAARFLESRLQAPELVAPTDERGLGPRRRCLGLVRDLEHRYWPLDALELVGAEVPEGEGLPPGQQLGYRGAAQELPRVGEIAEPARDDDGGAEVAAPTLLLERLTDVQPHPDLEAPALRGATCRLLHRDRAADRLGGRGERGHQAVPHPLELLPAGRGNGLLEQPMVLLEQRLRALVPDPLHDLGRVDEVGKQNRGDARTRTHGPAPRLRSKQAPISSRCFLTTLLHHGRSGGRPGLRAPPCPGGRGVRTPLCRR